MPLSRTNHDGNQKTQEPCSVQVARGMPLVPPPPINLLHLVMFSLVFLQCSLINTYVMSVGGGDREAVNE